MALWSKIRSLTVAEAFFAGYGDFGKTNGTYHLGTAGPRNKLIFSTWGPTLEGPPLELGRWYHIAVTNERTHVVLYVDGTPIKDGSVTIDTKRTGDFYMGSIGKETWGNVRKLDGLIDDVQIYSRALNPVEIRNIYESNAKKNAHPLSQ